MSPERAARAQAWPYGNALSAVATALAEAGRYAEAREVAGTIELGWKRVKALSSVAAALAQAEGDHRAEEVFGEAREVANSLGDLEQRSEALSSVAVALVQARRYAEAREVISTIKHWKRAEALSPVAAALAQAGESHLADKMFEEAREAASAIESDDRRDTSRAEALGSVAAALAQAGRFGEAREVADSIKHWRRAVALSVVAADLARAGRYEEAQAVAGTIEDDRWRSKALSSMGAVLARAGEDHRADEMFEEARKAASTRSVADALAQAERFSYAFAILGLSDLDDFLQVLAEWGPSFEKVASGLAIGTLREATGIAGWVRSDWREIHALLSRPANSEKRGVAGEAP